jgi:hypothetical protein
MVVERAPAREVHIILDNLSPEPVMTDASRLAPFLDPF